ADWSKPDNRTGWILNRGFTGHEHIDQFGIINMNGRAYDPLTAQFLSPDPYVQDTENWINYNRYAYCLHNPVKYTDPSGNEFVDFYGNKSDKEKDQLIKNIETQRAMWKTKMEEQRKQMDLHKWDVNLTKYENAKNAYEDYGERIKNLDQSIIDINFLHADTENKYAFNKTNGGKHFVVKDPNGIVYIETSGDEFSIHEITHIRQSLKAGGLKFGTKGAEKNKLLNAGTGISPFRRSYNEVEAYQMQHSFNGSFRGARFLNEINYNSVGNMRNENYPFELIYPEIHLYARSLKK
ncbi:MAG: RHS repeat-associated core domain-containing protein, partial [Firmicutes bacterium]|nr:RHS repeat-associated core domain-containing protein [Bacillota bacterium]